MKTAADGQVPRAGKGSSTTTEIRAKRAVGRWLSVGLVLTAVVAAKPDGLGIHAPPSTSTPHPTVTVRVYNYADVSSPLLRRAEAEAGRILSGGGVGVLWVDCLPSRSQLHQMSGHAQQACTRPLTREILVLRILPRATPANAAFREPVFGFTQGSNLASVFYGRIENFAHGVDGDETEIPVILGNVIAHELGHELLGASSHSPKGILRGQWDRTCVRQALMGRQLFTPPQSTLLRAWVLTTLPYH